MLLRYSGVECCFVLYYRIMNQSSTLRRVLDLRLHSKSHIFTHNTHFRNQNRRRLIWRNGVKIVSQIVPRRSARFSMVLWKRTRTILANWIGKFRENPGPPRRREVGDPRSGKTCEDCVTDRGFVPKAVQVRLRIEAYCEMFHG
jgi:hypothetical protein